MIEKIRKKVPVWKAILWIILSTVTISGSTYGALLYYKIVQDKRYGDPKYNIVAIVQSTPSPEGLKTVYLAELLGLSADKPQNIFLFNTEEAKQKLLACPLIKSAEITKITPGTLFIKYIMRKPIALLGDYTNTAIDGDGILLPIKPFFTPKNLPEIFLGQSVSFGEKGIWGNTLDGPRAEIALEVLQFLEEFFTGHKHYVKKIDSSKAYIVNFGERGINVFLEEWVQGDTVRGSILRISPRMIRISTENFRQELANYKAMLDLLRQTYVRQSIQNPEQLLRLNPLILEMRVPHIALIQKPE